VSLLFPSIIAHALTPTYSVLQPNASEVDRSSLDPSASASPAFEGVSSTSVSYSAPEPTTTRSVPAVLTTGPAVATSTEESSATGTGASAAPSSTYNGAAAVGYAKAGAAVFAGLLAAAVALAH
jgi:hypothetical protein